MFVSRVNQSGNLQSHSPITSPLPPSEFIRRFPEWRVAAEAACNSVGSLECGGYHKGGVIFVGHGIVAAPLHLLMSPGSPPLQNESLTTLMQNLKVRFTTIDPEMRRSFIPDFFSVCGVIEEFPEKDFCLLYCESDFCRHPAISNSKPAESLFAQIDENGQLLLSLVSSGHSHFWEEGYYTHAPTRAGSSGGIYFDIRGAFIAIHLSRHTEFSGMEKKGILAKDMVKYSETLLNLQHICILPSALEFSSILHPPITDNPHYENEAAPVKGCLYGNNYSCPYYEIRYGKQRSLSLTMRNQNLPTITAEYQLRFQYGKYVNNVHKSGVYSDGEPEFYRKAAEGFVMASQMGLPQSFAFEYRKTDFVAILGR